MTFSHSVSDKLLLIRKTYELIGSASAEGINLNSILKEIYYS